MGEAVERYELSTAFYRRAGRENREQIASR